MGVGIAFVVLIGSCVALIGGAAHELNKEQQAHAITQAQFNAIPLGITQQDVVSRLGKHPEDAQQFVQKGILNENDIHSSCIYYNKKGESFGSRYQFCFTENRLDSKNAY